MSSYIYIYQHSTMRMMKYDPGKIVNHGYKLHVISLITFHV